MNYPIPPQNALRFLRWFCRDDYLEEIEGNLLELYEQQYEESPNQSPAAVYLERAAALSSDFHKIV